MKHWIISCLLIPLVFVACAEKKNGSSDNQVATVPPPSTCIDGSTYCNSGQYGYYNGYAAYPRNPYYYNTSYAWGGNGYYGNFCQCPAGHRPVYNGQYGLGCIAINQFQPYANGAMYWGWGANNNQWVNIQQISNTQGYPSNAGGCFQNVAQSCFVDQVNSCGANNRCQPTGAGSRLGICVAGSATNTSSGSLGGYR